MTYETLILENARLQAMVETCDQVLGVLEQYNQNTEATAQWTDRRAALIEALGAVGPSDIRE